jgi:hypothetical protein
MTSDTFGFVFGLALIVVASGMFWRDGHHAFAIGNLGAIAIVAALKFFDVL